jgi:hypothetical protein
MRTVWLILGVLLVVSPAETGLALASDLSYAVPLLDCPDGGRIEVPMRSTSRQPDASGSARLTRRSGTTEIDVRLQAMKPASLYGGDYSTYVLWIVPRSGAAKNLGEIALDGSHARLKSAADESLFGLMVTAEPHFLVSAPSSFVALAAEPGKRSGVVRQPLLEGRYEFERSTLDDVRRAGGNVHSDVRQAFTAVRLAQRAGAATLAPEEYARARRALEETFALRHEQADQTAAAAQARETVRLAVAAERIARERALRLRSEKSEPAAGKEK